MRRLTKSARFALGVLLAAALALSPVVAFAAAQPMPSGEAMAAHDDTPCDMPCDDCGDEAPLSSCAMACLGLTAAVPPVVIAAIPAILAERVEIRSNVVLAGRDREPDKPPPRLVLA